MKLLLPLMGLISCLAVCGCAAQPGAEGKVRVYIGTYTSGPSKGIYSAVLDRRTGDLKDLALTVETKNPSFLAFHPRLPVLYAVGEIGGGAGKPGGAVSAFAIDAKAGGLTLLNQQSSGGAGPCYVSVDPTGRTVLVANYGGGSIASLPLEADGRLKPPATVIQHTGASVNPKRQTAPHAHSIWPEPGTGRAWVCDLGLDKVFAYGLNPTEGKLVETPAEVVAMKPGAGPRQLAAHPNGNWYYVVNELDCTVTRLGKEGKQVKAFESVSTLQQAVTNNTCAEIELHPSGRFVYASNRGADSIAVFAVNPDTGVLTWQQEVPTGGKMPRFFGIDPSGGWVLAGNQASDTVAVFRVDQASGKLTATGQTVTVGAPVCFVFREL
jgi:6-phosphogluconolactonase